MYDVGMNMNPYRTPEPSNVQNDSSRNKWVSLELFSAMLWSNVGLVAAYLLLSGIDWLFVSWISPETRKVNVAWSKLLFMLIATNMIIYYVFVTRHNDSLKNQSIDEQAH